MKALTWDPEEVEDEAVNIEGTLDRYFAAYYAPIVSALENSPRTAERYPGFVTTQLDGLGVTFGLRRDMYEALAGPGGRIDVAENWDGLARLALGDDFESFIEATGASADEHVPELQGGYDSGEGAEFDVRTPAPARGDAFERATAFPDATLFATNWEDAIHADDWVEA